MKNSALNSIFCKKLIFFMHANMSATHALSQGKCQMFKLSVAFTQGGSFRKSGKRTAVQVKDEQNIESQNILASADLILILYF